MYFAVAAALTTAATRLAESVGVDRKVLVYEDSVNGAIGFTETTALFSPPGAPGTARDVFEFVLPAGEELWARAVTGSGTLSVLVTSVGR